MTSLYNGVSTVHYTTLTHPHSTQNHSTLTYLPTCNTTLTYKPTFYPTSQYINILTHIQHNINIQTHVLPNINILTQIQSNINVLTQIIFNHNVVCDTVCEVGVVPSGYNNNIPYEHSMIAMKVQGEIQWDWNGSV